MKCPFMYLAHFSVGFPAFFLLARRHSLKGLDADSLLELFIVKFIYDEINHLKVCNLVALSTFTVL